MASYLFAASLLLLGSTTSYQSSPEPAPAKVQETQLAAKDAADTVRCRKLEVTGSLIRKVRVCKTNAEWRAIAEQQNRDAENLVERNRGGCQFMGPDASNC